MMDRVYKPNEFAKALNVSVTTLQRWDREGTLKAFRNPKNRRFYTETQLKGFMGEKPDNESGKTVIYARVSNRGQKDDLDNQIEFLRQYANSIGLIVDNIITDIGSGLNYNRLNWNELLGEVSNHQISKILIAYKDRFIRFGYEWFERFCKLNGTNIIVVNNEKLSPEKELVEDLISIIHVFSCRIYGLRKYKKILVDDSEL